MTIKCCECGQQMLVDDNLADGQRVKCPFCGKKSEYSKPSRIAVPYGKDSQIPPRLATAAVNKPEPQMTKSSEKPRLSIIRPNKANVPKEDPSVTAILQKQKVRSTKSREHPIYYSVAILVAGVCVAGIFALNHRQRQEEREFVAEEHRKEFVRREAEEKRRMQREAEAREREEKRMAEVAAQKKAKEEEALAQKEKLAAEKAKESEMRRLREARQAVIRQAFKVRYDYWRKCPKEDRPESITERHEYTCILPRGEGSVDCLLITAIPNEGLTIKTYEEDGTQNAMKESDFHAMLKLRSPYLVLSAGKGWICGVDKEPGECPVVDDRSYINPSEKELGALYGFLKSGSADVSTLLYNVYFVAKNGGREFVRRVKFGEIVSAGDLKPIIREDLQEKSDAKKKTGKGKYSSFKRTVVFGAVPNIKRPISGPIVIPYSMPAYDGYGVDYKLSYWNWKGDRQTYSRKSSNSRGTREQEYLNLRAVAIKEDQEEAEWKRRQYAAGMKDSHFEVPESAVEKILFSGKFVYSSYCW